MQIYLVGGAVRDALLDHPAYPVKEQDWVIVGETPEAMLERGYKPVGQSFPVFLHPKTGEEYALARKEKKTAPGYQGFSFQADPEVTLEEDLSRRDLTINAIAQHPDGSLIDPYGGQADLEKRILRHVSPAFVEDPVRLLRVARFATKYAALGFTIADETLELLRQMVDAGEINHLVAERVWQELEKSLSYDRPSVFFEVLRSCDALKIVFPEIDALYGVPNPEKWHPEIDTGIHTMMVLEQSARLSDVTEVRFAALLHDLGKGLTDPALWPKHHGHEEAGVPVVEALCDRFRVPKRYKALAVLATRYHGMVARIDELRPATILKMLNALDAFRRPDRFKLFLLACEADSRGRTGYEDAPYPQVDQLFKFYEVANTVSIQDLLAQGLEGNALAEALHSERVEIIKKVVSK